MSANPYGVAARRFERKKAKDVGGLRVPLSGGGSIKGDVLDRICLTECKVSHRVDAKGEKEITIKKAWLIKMEEEAKLEGKPFCRLSFRFSGQGERKSWSIVPDELFDEMIRQLTAYMEQCDG